jgi:hypothetical protein
MSTAQRGLESHDYGTAAQKRRILAVTCDLIVAALEITSCIRAAKKFALSARSRHTRRNV